MQKPHARIGLSVDHGVSSVVHSATKIAHRPTWLISHPFGMLRTFRCEGIPWLSRRSFGGDGLFARANFIFRQFINSSDAMGLRISGSASKSVGLMAVRRRFFSFITGLGNLTKRSTDRRAPMHRPTLDECLLNWRMVNVMFPRLFGRSFAVAPITRSMVHQRGGEIYHTAASGGSGK
jgi:hypothetical protein